VNADTHKASGTLPLFLAVYLGGGIGTLSRFELGELLPADPTNWPWHTFIANIVACAVLSFVLAHRERGWGGDTRTALIATGFCGGLSTFSALQLEIYRMFDAGSWLLAIGYLAASVSVGIALITLARRYVSRGEDVA
jgi:CrcB protein